MENMLIKLNEYNPKKETYKTQKTSTVLNARKMIIDAFENGIFSLPKQPPSGLFDCEEDGIDLL